MTNDKWLDVAQELARATGAIALTRYRKGIQVDLKSDQSPVTEADRAAERFAREWIGERFPAHGVIGEEFGEHQPDAELRWFIDPIDGTRTFVAGVPLWGTLVGLCRGETVIAGAAAFPAADEWIAAAPGSGCWANGSRCSVSTVGTMERATVLTTDTQFRYSSDSRRAAFDRLASKAGMSRTWGDCYGYLLVATGRAEVMVDGAMRPWDAAPFLPIITEAGGTFVDFNGRPTVFGDGTVATNALLREPALDLLGIPR